MTKKEVKEKITRLRKLYEEEDFDSAHSESESFVLELFEDKKFSDIVEADKKLESIPIMFEVAYSYDAVGDIKKAKEIYELLLTFPVEKNNPSILNNLSNIEKQEKNIDKAFKLIKKAYKNSSGKDEIINNNYSGLLKIIEEKEEKEAQYKTACDTLERESDWALEKLSTFIKNAKKDKEFNNNKIPIPKWKFKILIGTDEFKADSLREQWLTKGYIYNTKERGKYSEIVYEINPNIEKNIQKLAPFKLEKNWAGGIENLNVDYLDKLQYFAVLEKINKTNKKYKDLLKRDFDELIVNYTFKNKKSVVVLSGSLVELIFNYHCEKKKIKNVQYNISNKKISKNIHEANLNDFLKYFEEDKDFKKVIITIGHLSRVYRNFVHPGNEIKNKENLDESKMKLCFHSVVEVINYLL
jgi:hypothetical protein